MTPGSFFVSIWGDFRPLKGFYAWMYKIYANLANLPAFYSAGTYFS